MFHVAIQATWGTLWPFVQPKDSLYVRAPFMAFLFRVSLEHILADSIGGLWRPYHVDMRAWPLPVLLSNTSSTSNALENEQSMLTTAQAAQGITTHH
jgi:hypothetical protein